MKSILIVIFVLLSNSLMAQSSMDRGKALVAVIQSSFNFREIPDAFKDDRKIAIIAVKQTGWLLEYASDRLKNNQEVVREAVSEDG
ncbi:MAG: DUF4116 domain-containing protein, partial [Halobacteriovoraceae bacterium]|nr:DUF4116 domain-containing protein [Halobacteriovoraceae bacterium]